MAPEAEQHALEELPVETLIYLLGSRYCETDRFVQIAWSLFGKVPKGWPLVKAICDYVHDRIKFGYEHASPTKTAWDAHAERRGVCRDFAHLAITLCRCMNVPARYCTGYLGDIGVPPDPTPMDFSAWFEVYLGGRWYTFDARHNTPRIGRILMARGRDATDVAIVTSFGPCTLAGFKVITDEVARTHRQRSDDLRAASRRTSASLPLHHDLFGQPVSARGSCATSPATRRATYRETAPRPIDRVSTASRYRNARRDSALRLRFRYLWRSGQTASPQ